MPTTKHDTEKKIDTSKVDSNIVDQSVKEDTLTIQISQLKNIASTLNISIYGIDNVFPSTTDQLKTYSFSIHGSTHSAKLQGIKHGTYAIAMFQDENNSGQINKNFLGIPTERYGFSQNIVPKFKAPSFDDCKFNFNSESTVVHIRMIP